MVSCPLVSRFDLMVIVFWTLAVPLVLTAQRQRGERSSSSSSSTPSSSSSSFHQQQRGKHKDDSGVCELEINCKGDDVSLPMSVKLPIRGPRGPPGSSGDKGQPGEDGMPGLPGLPGLSASVPKKVAFFVGLSENIGPVVENTDVVFDRVVTNIGGAYNEETGHFTAPVNATYQFNVIVSAQGRQKAAVMLVKDGEMVATVWAESIPYWASASNIVVLSLDKGDSVWLMLLDRASYLHGYMYTTFSGFIIFEN